MDIIRRTDAPVFAAPGATFTAYAAPSRGTSKVSMWCLELDPGSTSPLHEMDCEEVFLGLEGRAIAMIDDTEHSIGVGDCLILPPGTPFTLHVPERQPFRALACIPAGGRATMIPDGTTFAPPWAE
jgi:mannose-6-phosphate isomerase-like protein (cupin superfamily)